MKPWTTLARANEPDGQALTLQQRDGVFVVRLGGHELMSSARHHSEEEMARLGLEHAGAAEPRVLIGGLGLGYTARAALNALPPGGRVVIAELSPAVVEWNRTFVADLAGRPLEDARVEVALDDVAQVMRRHRAGFDCILLDVDNGPIAIMPRNEPLYGAAGIASMKAALRPGGVAVVWSAGPEDKYLGRLRQAGLEAHAERSAARRGGAGSHVLFVAKVSASRRRSQR